MASLCGNSSVEFKIRGCEMKKMRRGLYLPNDGGYDVMNSPVGNLAIVTSPQGLHAILWDKDCDDKRILALTRSPNDKIIVETKKQLGEYFQGKRKIFDLPLVINGTDFQMQVWQELLNIPYAKTISYGETGGKNWQ